MDIDSRCNHMMFIRLSCHYKDAYYIRKTSLFCNGVLVPNVGRFIRIHNDDYNQCGYTNYTLLMTTCIEYRVATLFAVALEGRPASDPNGVQTQLRIIATVMCMALEFQAKWTHGCNFFKKSLVCWNIYLPVKIFPIIIILHCKKGKMCSSIKTNSREIEVNIYYDYNSSKFWRFLALFKIFLDDMILSDEHRARRLETLRMANITTRHACTGRTVYITRNIIWWYPWCHIPWHSVLH